jgi:hypothetical protein
MLSEEGNTFTIALLAMLLFISSVSELGQNKIQEIGAVLDVRQFLQTCHQYIIAFV